VDWGVEICTAECIIQYALKFMGTSSVISGGLTRHQTMSKEDRLAVQKDIAASRHKKDPFCEKWLAFSTSEIEQLDDIGEINTDELSLDIKLRVDIIDAQLCALLDLSRLDGNTGDGNKKGSAHRVADAHTTPDTSDDLGAQWEKEKEEIPDAVRAKMRLLRSFGPQIVVSVPSPWSNSTTSRREKDGDDGAARDGVSNTPAAGSDDDFMSIMHSLAPGSLATHV
jgi:hypothetical protein